MLKRTKRHPLARWAWWQMLALSAVGFGFLGATFGFFPPISISVIRLGLLSSVPVIIAAMWSWWTYSWWARLSVQALVTLQFLAIAARCWTLVIGISWVWLVPILSAYLLAWALPALNPRLSAILWREQWTPQTRVGRALLGLALAIGPSAGVLGASFGMFGNRFGETSIVVAVMAALSSSVAIGFAFAISYQLWPERPWTKDMGAKQ
ncbi:MAG: hypothetical protein ACRDHG_15350 [Anaerolineales bacterium]